MLKLLHRKIAMAVGIAAFALPYISSAQYCTTNLHSVACSATDNINTVSIAGTTLNNPNTGCSATTGMAYTAYPATGSTTATLLRQTSYVLSVTSTANSILSVWIDYNQNNTFEASEWQQIATTTTPGTAVTANITIPNNAVLGQTGMRIRSRLIGNANGAGDACLTMGSGETEDYTITIGPAPVCTTPVTPGTVSGNLAICTGLTTTLTLSGQTLGTNLQWQSSPDGNTWTDITGATNISYTTPALSTAQYYRVNVTCGASTVPTPSVQVLITTGAVTTFPYNETFDGVPAPGLPCGWTVVNVNNDPKTWETNTTFPSSGANALRYPYSSSLQADDWAFSPSLAMDATKQYLLTFKYRVYSATYPEALEVKVGNAPTVAAMTTTLFTNSNLTNTTYATATATINVPASGNYNIGFHAMSLADQWDIFVDDVSIIELASCSGTPVAGTVPTAPISICTGNSTTITATGATQGGGIVYQWEQATTATGPWTNVTGGSGANTTNYTTPSTLTANTFYRLKVTCNGTNVANSAAVEVNVNTGAISTFPHTQDFDAVTAPAIPCGWTILNVNSDANTWETNTSNASTTPNALRYSYNSTNAADDWAFSPAISMNAANQYLLTFKYRVYSATFPEALEVKLGNAATVAGMSTTLFTNSNLTNITYATATATITPSTTGTYHIGFHVFSLADQWDLYIDDITITELSACTGTPVAGTVPAGPLAVCVGNVNTITATGATQGTGIVYQWEQATAATGPWTNVTGGSGANTTAYTLPATLTATTYYRLKVTCSGTSTATTSAVQVNINPPVACYCSANLHSIACSTTDNINTVSIAGTTLNNANTGCSATNGMAYTAYPATGSTTATLARQGTYNLSVTSTANSIMSVWIDFNQNGSFEATEWTQISTTSIAGTAVVVPITIPNTAVLGLTGMRIRSRLSGNPNGAGDACLTMGSGETEDYIVTIGPACTTAVPTVTTSGATTFCTGGSVTLTASSTTTGATYQWFNNGTAITGATAATYNATLAGAYTVVANANNCSSGASAATNVTVNATPATPTITKGGVSGQTLTSSAATGNQWYLNGQPITGATGQTFQTTGNGAYTVVVTVNGCSSAASSAVNITNTGIAADKAGLGITIYPNPNQGKFDVKLTGYNKKATISLYSLTGQRIYSQEVTAASNEVVAPMHIQNLAAGTYLLQVVSEKGVKVERLIVE